MRDDEFEDDAPELGELLYQVVRDAPDMEAAIAALPLAEWRELHGWLLRHYQENAVSGHMLGIQFVDAGKRIMNTTDKGGEE